jgi:hypothetical protein
MGHASIVTTMRYMHATDKGKRGDYCQTIDSGHKNVTEICHKRKAAGQITYLGNLLQVMKTMVSHRGLGTSDQLIKSQLVRPAD